MTQEEILSRLLSKISNEYDKTVGSFFYDVEKPVSTELETVYAQVEDILKNGFAKTAEGEYLDNKVLEQGLTRKSATASTVTVKITGTPNSSVSVGDKVASEELVFTIIENASLDSNGIAHVLASCDTLGRIGNIPIGAINKFPVTLPGLVSVTNQTLPWNHRGWHGGGSSNNTHIGVEMCEPSVIKYTGGSSFTCSDKAKAQESVRKTYNSAVELFAMLCKMYNLNPLKDIVSHREGHALGIATNHGDPEHLWKGVGLNYTMDGFRADVKKKMDNKEDEPMTTEERNKFNALVDAVGNLTEKVDKLEHKMIYAWVDSNMPDWAKPTITKLMAKGYLKGDEEGKLGLDDNMLRMLVINDRAGLYGE